jgi:peptidoglycan/xylan/chitin deacetylase (PgdA/CDA1 family)
LHFLTVPGHTLETFPEDCAAVRDKGHEIGLHGYSHENPVDMTFEQQRDVLDKTYKQLTEFCGKPPRGSVAPWWETSQEGCDLLLSYGIEYDHSMSHEDHKMYWLRTGDQWTKIDYSKKAEEWMKPLVRGEETGLVEIPGSWYIDDLPPMMFIKNSANSHGWVNPRDVEAIWMDHFDYFYREYDEFVFPMTIHPDVSGRPHVLLMHERYVVRSLDLQLEMIANDITGSSSTLISTRASNGLRWSRCATTSRRTTKFLRVPRCQHHPAKF